METRLLWLRLLSVLVAAFILLRVLIDFGLGWMWGLSWLAVGCPLVLIWLSDRASEHMRLWLGESKGALLEALEPGTQIQLTAAMGMLWLLGLLAWVLFQAPTAPVTPVGPLP